MTWKDLSDKTRVWIYQSPVRLTDAQVDVIRKEGENFIAKWNTHGTPMQAALEVFHNRFVVLFADEAELSASGCSIDQSSRFIKAVSENLGVDLFDRMQVAFRDGQEIKTLHFSDLGEMFRSGKITRDTIVFNNLVRDIRDFRTNWEVPLGKSWHFSSVAA